MIDDWQLVAYRLPLAACFNLESLIKQPTGGTYAANPISYQNGSRLRKPPVAQLGWLPCGWRVRTDA
jgi:hypothetical protein